MQLTTTIGNLLAATLLCYTSSTLGLEKHTYRKNITIGVVIQNTDSIQTNVLKKEFRHQTSVSSTYEYLKHYKLTIVAIHLPEITYPLGTLNALCDHFIKERVVAIIFLANSENYGRTTASVQYFMHLASYTGIPIIAWNADNSGLLVNRDLNKYRLLQMAPTLEHQADAMLQILMRYNWRKFAVIVTTIAGGDYFSETCHRLIREKDLPMEIIKEFEFNTNDANELNINLKQLADSEARIILLYATYAEAKFIFEKAQKFALTDAKHMWIVTQSVVSNKFPNTNELEHLPYSFPIGMIATHFNTKSRISRETADFALFDQIRNVMEVVKSGLNSMLGAHNFSIDLASTSNCDSDFNYTWQLGDEFYKFLKNVKIKDAEPHSSNSLSIEFDTSGYLKQTYLSILNLNANRMWRKIGDYSKGVVTINDISWPGGMHRPPLGYPEKYSVKVVTLDEPPFIIASEMDHVTKTCPSKQGVKCIWASKDSPKFANDTNYFDRNSSELKCCSGYCVDLLNELSHDLGFEYELYRVPDGLWGAKENRKWNGLVAELVEKRADFCVTALKLNSEREKDIEFSVPFLETGITILVAYRGGALSHTAFLEPFEYLTWFFILVVSIQAAAASIFVFEWLSPQSFDRKMSPPPGHRFSLCRSYWLVWATLFSASVNTDVPRSYIARFMALVWAAFSLTFVAIYTANLAAFMITRTEFYDLSGIDDPKINSPYTMNPPFRYGTVVSGNTDVTLRNNYEHLYRYIKSNGLFKANVSEGLAAVKRNEYDAFIYDSVVLQYLAGIDDNCEVGTVGKWFSMTGYGIGFPKNSKWLKKVNEKILKYQENGELERFKNFWFTGACTPKVRDKKNHSSPLGIRNFVSAFVLLAAGVAFSLLLIFVEYVYCKYLRHKLTKINKKGWFGLISLSMGRSMSLIEAVQVVHKEYKEEKFKSIRFHNRREKFLENELKNALLEISNLKHSTEATLMKYQEKMAEKGDDLMNPVTVEKSPAHESPKVSDADVEV